jgi:hypothetical protein
MTRKKIVHCQITWIGEELLALKSCHSFIVTRSFATCFYSFWCGCFCQHTHILISSRWILESGTVQCGRRVLKDDIWSVCHCTMRAICHLLANAYLLESTCAHVDSREYLQEQGAYPKQISCLFCFTRTNDSSQWHPKRTVFIFWSGPPYF